MRSSILSTLLPSILALAGAAASVASAETAPGMDVAAIDAYLRAQMATHHLPGLAIVIVEGERVVMARGYGNAGRGRPVTPQTQFNIGSCTKSFTALAVAQLAEQGRLELDAPVQRYLPWFRVADEAASAQITVRHLLNQTSGLSEAGDPEPGRHFSSLPEQARALRGVRLTAPVGTEFQYYNPNYRVLGLLIEVASGQSYEDYVRDRVLTPLAMSGTVARPDAATSLAGGHGEVLGLPLPRSQPYHAGSLPSGFLISTAEDLGHYLIALLNGGQYGGTRLVQAATLAQMFAPPSGVNSERIAPPPAVAQMFGSPSGMSGGYGMGWIVGRSADGIRLVFHAGNLEFFHAELLLLPKEKRGLAILVNQNSVVRQALDQTPPWMGVAHLMLGTAPPPESGLPRWSRQGALRGRVSRWSRALVGLGLPLGFLLCFPLVLGLVLRVKTSWSGLFDFLPDVVMWLVLSATLRLLRGLALVAIVSRLAGASPAATTWSAARPV
jgi:CubicO group peptidase (beta-lactamase class C family)